MKAKCLLYCCILQEAAENRSWTHAWGGCETFKHKLHRRELQVYSKCLLSSPCIFLGLIYTSNNIFVHLSLERKRWMETVLETNMSANSRIPSRTASRALLSFPHGVALSNLWQQWRLEATIYRKHRNSVWERRAAGPMDPLLFFPSQSGESPLSPSAVSHSDSASSRMIAVAWRAPELLVGLSYKCLLWGDYPWRWSKAAISETSLWTEHLVSSCLYPPALVLPKAGKVMSASISILLNL